jgi:hypothetical protein
MPVYRLIRRISDKFPFHCSFGMSVLVDSGVR